MEKTEFTSYLEHLQSEGKVALNQDYQTDLENNYTIGYKQHVKIFSLIGSVLIVSSVIGYIY